MAKKHKTPLPRPKRKNPMAAIVGEEAERKKANMEYAMGGFRLGIDLCTVALYNVLDLRPSQMDAVGAEVSRLLNEEFKADLELAGERLQPTIEYIMSRPEEDKEEEEG